MITVCKFSREVKGKQEGADNSGAVGCVKVWEEFYTVNGEELDVFFASFAHSLANFAVKKKENLTAKT